MNRQNKEKKVGRKNHDVALTGMNRVGFLFTRRMIVCIHKEKGKRLLGCSRSLSEISRLKTFTKKLLTRRLLLLFRRTISIFTTSERGTIIPFKLALMIATKVSPPLLRITGTERGDD
ncbi:uncharacterized protein LOC143143614 [Ptiloglossa arizonensis]|uniref:uncharacterized protein LOC143143614 n=1 Tax=Ptiloglossa arizonensis TaxID=3350558 RepID=UPI003FA12EA0